MKHNGVIVRSVIASLIIISSGISCYFLSLRLTAFIYDLRAGKLLANGSHIASINMLKNAIRLQPSNYQLQRKLAGAYKQFASTKSDPKQLKQFMLKAEHHYLAAMQLNPYDTDTVYNLALVAIQLESADIRLNRQKNPDSYKIRTYFDLAIRLNPNQTHHRYALIHYLYSRNQTQPFLDAISAMMCINPGIYDYLKKNSFWSPQVQAATIKGLYNGIKANIRPSDAYRALSELYDRDNQRDRAVQSYTKLIALKSSPDKDRFKDYIHLGQLNLKRGRPQLAAKNFLAALDLSANRDDTLEQIYQVYQRERCQSQYGWLHLNLENDYLDHVRTQIIYARSFFDHKNYAKSKQILDKIINQQPVAQAYYYLARIAEIEKDWFAMERAIMKATALDPANIRYIQTLYSVHWQMDKLDILESELSKAIERFKTPNAWLFEGRARIRLKVKNYFGAINDWKVAIRLEPKRDFCYSQLAETYLKVGNIDKALNYYQKAIQINPHNQNFRKKLKAIKVKASKV